MVEFRKAYENEADSILDFINYVFSQAHYPHDFKKVNPHMYNSDYPFWDDHYVAVEDGQIRSTISVTKREYETAGIKLVYGHVGQVSVHPYFRGNGYMRELMRMGIADMVKNGYDFSNLGGLRQRYEYYGYIPADYCYNFNVTSTNTRHVLAGAEPRVTVKSDNGAFDVYLGEKKVGMIRSNVIALDDYSYAADAFEMYFRESGQSSITVRGKFYELPLVSALSKIAENVSVSQSCQMLVFNFRKCLLAGLKLRANAGLCADGELTVKVGDECFGLRVKGGEVEAFDCDSPMYEFTPPELQTLALSLTGAVGDRRVPFGWFPIELL